MIPFNNLIENPEDFQPLSTHKGWKNRPSEIQFDKVDIHDVFISEPNQAMLAQSLYQTAKNNGFGKTISEIKKLVPKAMEQFCKRNNIYSYATVEDEATQQTNWSEVLKTINNDFIKHCYNLFKWNQFNPFREHIMVGDSTNRHQKKYSELLAHDIPTIDIWARQEVQRMNKHFRFNNAIPRWQTSMHTRNYDLGNEGLRHTEADRASLDTPIYGYDMTNIHDLLDKWNDSNWFGL